MRDERYVLDNFSIYDRNKKLNMEQICYHLNDYEKTRIRKNKLIAEYRQRERYYMDIIYGIKAYIRLFVEELTDN